MGPTMNAVSRFVVTINQVLPREPAEPPGPESQVKWDNRLQGRMPSVAGNYVQKHNNSEVRDIHTLKRAFHQLSVSKGWKLFFLGHHPAAVLNKHPFFQIPPYQSQYRDSTEK